MDNELTRLANLVLGFIDLLHAWERVDIDFGKVRGEVGGKEGSLDFYITILNVDNFIEKIITKVSKKLVSNSNVTKRLFQVYRDVIEKVDTEKVPRYVDIHLYVGKEVEFRDFSIRIKLCCWGVLKSYNIYAQIYRERWTGIYGELKEGIYLWRVHISVSDNVAFERARAEDVNERLDKAWEDAIREIKEKMAKRIKNEDVVKVCSMILDNTDKFIKPIREAFEELFSETYKYIGLINLYP